MSFHERLLTEAGIERRWAWSAPTGKRIVKGEDTVPPWNPPTRYGRNFEDGPRRPVYGAECGLVQVGRG